jgi:hypothetical protein
MTKKCECLRKNGEKCGAYAPTGKSVCIFHDPAREAEGRRARRAGGLRRSRAIAVLPSAAPDHPLGNPKEVSGLLETVSMSFTAVSLIPGLPMP